MRETTKLLLFWGPRILAVLFAVFLGVFALDVFGEHYGFWKTIKALLIHLIPTAIVLVLLAAAWRWEIIGALGFTALGVLYIILAWGRFPLSVFFVISGPLLIIGILFLLNWLYRADFHVRV